VIDPSLFTVERLLEAMFDDVFGNVDAWRKYAEIVPDYMPPYPHAETKPTCVVKMGGSFLRYSAGPRQQYVWDMYGDDMGTPERALLALLAAPIPPWLVKLDEAKKLSPGRDGKQERKRT
jgi:hypothetical protein